MPHQYSIRREVSGDHDAIRHVTTTAFAESEFGHNGEAQLVDALRSEFASRSLSLVACLGKQIVGHALFTPASIQTPQEEIHGKGLAPLSVAPEHQRRGVGSILIRTALQTLFDDDCSFIIVLGDGEFYSRFGFVPAAEANVHHGFAGILQDVFFIQPHPQKGLARLADGKAYYAENFGPQHAES